MRKKFLKIPDFLHNCGKLLWRTCLLIVYSEVLIEGGSFRYSADI